MNTTNHHDKFNNDISDDFDFCCYHASGRGGCGRDGVVVVVWWSCGGGDGVGVVVWWSCGGGDGGGCGGVVW